MMIRLFSKWTHYIATMAILFLAIVMLFNRDFTTVIVSRLSAPDDMRVWTASSDVQLQSPEETEERSKPFPYLSDYKNPCWVENFGENFSAVYDRLPFISGRSELPILKDIMQERWEKGQPWRLKCLPYVFLAGVTKSGTTDFFDVLLKHPDIYSTHIKEPMYWNRRRQAEPIEARPNAFIGKWSMSTYVTMFDYAAHQINMSVSERDTGSEKGTKRHEGIILDGSSYLFWEDNGWPQDPANSGLSEPRRISAHAVREVIPQAKIIVLLRHPSKRVHSAYAMYDHVGISEEAPHHFHGSVQKAIADYKKCFTEHGVRACAYNVSLALHHWPVSLVSSLYSVFLKDYLNIFKKENILVVIAEEYYEDRMSTLNQILSFLDLEPMTESLTTLIENKRPSFKRKYSPMLPETKEILDEFFQPFVKELESTLNKQLWK